MRKFSSQRCSESARQLVVEADDRRNGPSDVAGPFYFPVEFREQAEVSWAASVIRRSSATKDLLYATSILRFAPDDNRATWCVRNELIRRSPINAEPVS